MAPTLTILATLDFTDGAEPEAPLAIDANGDLIGTATVGGADGWGTVFELAKTATGYASTPTTLVSFNISDGSDPDGSLIFDSSGDLLTTTIYGGSGGNYYLSGTVIEIPLIDGVYADTAIVLANFDVANVADGLDPEGGLLADASGDLFGTTIYNGTSPGYGTVFELANTAGVYASTPDVLVTFDGLDGSEPYGTLIADANGDLFGVTELGGSTFSASNAGYGVVFEIVKTAGVYAGTPKILAEFTGSNGEYPGAGLVADANGDLFGVTQSGGTYGDGTIFEIPETAGVYAPLVTLASFNGTDGTLPLSALLIDADGNLFGATETTVFELAKTATSYAATPIVLANVADEIGGLTADAEGDLFGTEATTGPDGDGSIFEITDSGFVTNNIYWNGGTGSWDVATNWTPQEIPTGTNIVYIVATGTNVVNAAAGGGDAAASLTLSANSTLNISTELSVGNALANSGNVDVDDGATLVVAGTVDNTGTISLDSTGDDTTLALSGIVTFEGSGTVTLADDVYNQSIVSEGAITGDLNPATLENQSNISGSGYFSGSGNGLLTIDNESGGVISATGLNPLYIYTQRTVSNEGTLQATGIGTLVLEDTVDNSGGTVQALGTSGASVQFSGIIEGGTLTTSGTAQNQSIFGTLNGSSQGPLTNTGLVEVGDGYTLTLLGTIDNTAPGTIAVGGAIAGSQLIISGAVTLEGDGAVTLSDNANNQIVSDGAAATLSNSNTISGAGTIGDGHHLSIDNDGVINANTALELTLLTNYVIGNAGTLEATGAGGLQLDTETIDNSGGIIEAQGQTDDISNYVDISAATIEGGELTTSMGGVIVAGNATLDGSSQGTLTNSGDVAVFAGPTEAVTLTLKGTIDNTGEFELAESYPASLVISGDVSLQGDGEVELEGPDSQIVSDGAAATLSNSNTISGAGTIGDGHHLSIDNDGVINANTALELTLLTNYVIGNAGTLEATGAGGLQLDTETIDNSGGIIEAQGQTDDISNYVDISAATIEGGELTTSMGGVIVAGNATLDGSSQGTLTNSGDVAVFAGPTEAVTLTLKGTIDNTGEFELAESYPASLVISGDVSLQGDGEVELEGPDSQIVSDGAAATLSNSNTISGAGTIGDAFLTLNNQGVIDATGANSLIIDTNTITNDGALGAQNGGILDIASAVTGTGSAVIGSGTIELGASFAEDVSFTAGDAGALQIDHYALFGGTISGFTVGDVVDLGDAKYDPAWTAGIEPNSNNVLQFVENGTSYTLDLDPADDFVGHDFLLSSIDGGAGTAITVGQVPITGTVTIPAGETASDVVVGDGGELIVAPGGSETGATVTNGGTLNVENDASASGGTVSGGGTLNVSSGGTASGITVSDGGHQYVESGGTANGTVLTDPGIQIVVSGGTASNTVDGGEQDVYGSAVSTTVINGGLEIVETGGLATGTTVSSTGDLTVDSGGVIAGDTLMTAGGEVILDAGAVVSSGASFSFLGVGNTLQIDGPALPVTVISGFVNGDTITLPGAAGGSIGTVDSSAGDTSVEILDSEGNDLGTLDLDGNYLLENLALDASGNLTTEQSVPCYCSGTLIKTSRGPKKVEKLKIGDSVMTASGTARPIKWIGRRSYNGRFVMGRRDILPVCIKAGALDDNVPKRDLWISPNHAMYLDGVLIEAKDLVNGASIVQTEHADKVEYFHIELESHDVIIAEGALSESFIDDDSRGMFHNAHEYCELYANAALAAARYCAPRLDQGYELEMIRQRLARRAGLAPSDERTRARDLHGFLDRVTPCIIEGWAQNLDHPEAPVCLDIFAGGRLIGQVLANRYRDDLKRAGIGSGCHSFRFAVPGGVALTPDSVAVKRSLDGKVLPRSAQAKRVRKWIAA